MKRYNLLSSLALASILLLTLAGCNKNDNSGSSNSGSSNSGKSSSSSGGESKSSTSSSRIVGTWADGAETHSTRIRFTEDGKVYENCGPGGEEQSGTYTVDGNTITMNGIGKYKEFPARTATLESDNRMRMERGISCEVKGGYLKK
jgi:uncharacterized lipoprotein YehR (DUF1307 family)